MRKRLWLLVPWAIGLLMGTLIYRYVESMSRSTSAAETPKQYVGTIRDVMHAIVEPASNALFDAVEIDVSAAGIKEKQPRTDEEWEVVEHGAIALAEAVTLMKMPGRPVAQPEEMNVDPDGPELPPTQIADHIARSRPEWDKHADQLLKTAIEALDIARAKNVQGLYDVGTKIDAACEGCHLAYWYPDDAKNRK
jgi:hypothetical protein